MSGKTLHFHGTENQILPRSVILAPVWTMNSRGKTWTQQADFKGNEIVRERGYMRVCTWQEGAAEGSKDAGVVVNIRQTFVWALRTVS